MPIDHLRIEDMSDREFLLAVHDLRDSDGWTDSEAVRERLNLSKRGIASSRLSWLARWGAVEREFRVNEAGHPERRKNGGLFYTQRWRLTVPGAAYANGTLKARQLTALDNMDDTQLLVLTAYVASRSVRAGDVGRTLVRREWRYGMAQR